MLLNNLFKSIIDLSFPNMMKYLFWACEEDTGIFEPMDQETYLKYRRMSKYKKEEMAGLHPDADLADSVQLGKREQPEPDREDDDNGPQSL